MLDINMFYKIALRAITLFVNKVMRNETIQYRLILVLHYLLYISRYNSAICTQLNIPAFIGYVLKQFYAVMFSSQNDPVLRVALIATPLFTGSIFYILENREREKLRKRQKKVNEQKYHAMFFNYLSWNPETKVRSPNWHTSVLKAMYREKMLGMLSSAVESIYLCNYHITLSTVYETLVAAYERGIDVKVISDGEMLTEKLSVIEKLCKIGKFTH